MSIKYPAAGLDAPFLFLVFIIVYALFNTTYFNPLTAPAYFAVVGVIGYLAKAVGIGRKA